MPVQIEAVTTAALSAALDASGRRHAALAANIANASTEGYAPVRLSFDAHLDEAQAMLREKGMLDMASAESLRGQTEPLLEAAVQPGAVRIDAEMSELASNAVHFQALTQGLSRHLGLIAMAAADGRK
jgi:flagellar basal-body rod protein FlgB